MADIKEDNALEQHRVTIETPILEEKREVDEKGRENGEEPQKTKTKRVASLDIFRGLTVAVYSVYFSFIASVVLVLVKL